MASMDYQCDFDIRTAKLELEDRGWTVIPGVVPHDECDRMVAEMHEWLQLFPEGKFPDNFDSILHKYRVSHLEPVWRARLYAHGAYSKIWGTEKLLTSVDGCAMGPPPETSSATKFYDPEKPGIHVDQHPSRRGLHAYQGSVFLEGQDEDDWCFKVVEYSHRHFADWFARHRGQNWQEPRRLGPADVQWFESRGCQVRRIAIPKGGMVLWDSRLFHAGAKPIRGRTNAGKWRYVVFVSQTPAIWASAVDYQNKRECYNGLRMSRHWSSMGSDMFPEKKASPYDVTALPPSAKTPLAMKLAGVGTWDFSDGKSNGPNWKPMMR